MSTRSQVNECNRLISPLPSRGVTIFRENMLIPKRLGVWLLERLLEGFLLGVLLASLLVRNLTDSVRPHFAAWISLLGASSAIVGVALFLHGYYLTTAFFGVFWRSTKSWLYGAITAALFVFHSHIAFLHGKQDFTPEARAMESPFLLCGACIVFGCAFAGNRVLNRWRQASGSSTPYASATAITLLVFALTNIAHFLRPATYNDSFRLYGLPFTFYREGGFAKEWVWSPGTFIWHGVLADAALLAGIVVLLAKAWQRVDAARAR